MVTTGIDPCIRLIYIRHYATAKGLFIWRGVTRQGELLGNGEIPAVIETNSNPG
jgi:hypothetical protein